MHNTAASLFETKSIFSKYLNTRWKCRTLVSCKDEAYEPDSVYMRRYLTIPRFAFAVAFDFNYCYLIILAKQDAILHS